MAHGSVTGALWRERWFDFDFDFENDSDTETKTDSEWGIMGGRRS
jgi:hypothetical protein